MDVNTFKRWWVYLTWWRFTRHGWFWKRKNDGAIFVLEYPPVTGKKFKVGQVVFAKIEGEYVRVVRVGPAQDLEMQEVETFNPRWGGKEIIRAKHLRNLTEKERAR